MNHTNTTIDDQIDVEGFSKLCGVVVFFAFWVSVVTIGYGVYLALLETPPDPEQGHNIRIMYVHVAAAWMSLLVYCIMAFASLMYLLTRSFAADMVARNSAPLGAAFTLMTLITGSLWAKTAWDMWWSWDSRLISVMILFFLYLGYMAITHVHIIEDSNRRIAAIMSLFGVANVPVIKFSVEWWQSVHPGADFLDSMAAMDPARVEPILIMMLGFLGIYLTCLLLRMQATLYQQKWRQIQLQSLAA